MEMGPHSTTALGKIEPGQGVGGKEIATGDFMNWSLC